MATMLGQVLVDDGAVPSAAVEAALGTQAETRERIGQILVRDGLDPEALARGLARQLRLTYAAPPLEPDPEAVTLLDREHATRLRMVPLAVSGRTLRVATADPLAAAAIDDLQFRTGKRADPVVASPLTIDRGLLAAYGDEAVRAAVGRLEAEGVAEVGDAEDDADVLREA